MIEKRKLIRFVAAFGGGRQLVGEVKIMCIKRTVIILPEKQHNQLIINKLK